MARWTVEFLDRRVRRELDALPADMLASFVHIAELLEEHGPQAVRMPYVRPLGRKLYEIRASGKDGIARAIYIAAKGRRLVVLHALVKKSEMTPKRAIDLALQRARRIE